MFFRYFTQEPSKTLNLLKKAPAMHAVNRQAKVTVIKAFTAIFEICAVRPVTSAEIPPTNMAMEATWANPYKAYDVITSDLG